MLGEGAPNFFQDTGPVAIVGVQDVHDFASGHLDAFVHGMVMAFVSFGNPAQVCVLLQHIHCPILGAAVDDQVFQIWIALTADTFDSLAQCGGTVEGRRDDRDGWLARHRGWAREKPGWSHRLSRPPDANTSPSAASSSFALDGTLAGGLATPPLRLMPKPTNPANTAMSPWTPPNTATKKMIRTMKQL